MKARAVTRDVGRALAMPYADVDRVAKMIPSDLGMSLKKALEISPELKTAYAEEDDTHKLIDMSLRLEGLSRHAGTHAAGVVICDKPVIDYVPLNLNDGVVTTQFPMKTVEMLGLLKMDFLGLRTLTVLRIAAEEVKRGKGVDVNVHDWSYGYDDPKVYEIIAQGKTAGVFQLESSGMTSFMREMQHQSLEDMTAGISLYRPGPMDYIPDYIKGKKNPSKIKYLHPSLEPILKATYGCMVYQEQVMQIVRDLAGYSLGRSDLIRRAMGKKDAAEMERERKNFIYGLEEEGVDGCVKRGIPEKIAAEIFNAMEKFASYAFNKPHAVGYAVIGYQTAWLKCYYPVEFMAALMTSVMDASAKVVQYI
jgi:DNA polymerase-3 subunit alpha